MKYQYTNNGVVRRVTLNNHKVIDERTKTFNSYHNAKQYFEEIREIERKRGSQITLLEQGGNGNGHKFNKKDKHNHNFDIRPKTEVMGMPIRI